MDLTYHENWPGAQQRLIAFWNGERMDRPAMHITIPKVPEECKPLPKAGSPRDKYTDINFLLDYYEASVFNHHYIAETIPNVGTGLQAGWLPAYGTELIFREDCIWIEPLFTDWNNAPDFRNAWKDKGWDAIRKIMQMFIEESKDRYFVGIPPYLPPNDLLSMLRGSGNFLMDLIEHPDEIKEALAVMTDKWLSMYREYEAMIHERFTGIFHHYPIWCPARSGTLQSDVSCMISPAVFEEFIVPELEKISGSLDYTTYHLDGPDAIKHLDRILDIPGISMLQWEPGAGNPRGVENWMHIFKKAQEKDKAIYLPVEPEKLELAIREFRPEKTFILTYAQSLKEGEELLRKAVQYTRRYWANG